MLAYITAVVVLIADQITKLLVANNMQVSEHIPVIQDVLNIKYIRNEGMAFGMFSGQRLVFMVPSVILIAAVIWSIVKYGKKNKLFDISMGLVLGGGVGNMIDRIFRGYVVDFVDFCAFDFWQWVFNLADAAVVVGAGLFVIALLTDKNLFPDDKKKSGEENE